MSNKQLAWSYFEFLNEDRTAEAAALLNPAGTWWSSSGVRRVKPMTEHLSKFEAAMKMVPMRFILHGAIEEGETVAIELESHADLPNGNHYNNVYTFVMTMWEGRILHVREYGDTAHVAAMAPEMQAMYTNLPEA
jgi:uncharacterized protein